MTGKTLGHFSKWPSRTVRLSRSMCCRCNAVDSTSLSHPHATDLRYVWEDTKNDSRVCLPGGSRDTCCVDCFRFPASWNDTYVIRHTSRFEAHNGCTDTNNPAPGVYICADGDPPGGHRLAFTWTPVLITESILLCLSLYRGWQNRKFGSGGSTVLRILTRDSVIYFLA